jgi:hypothetical protein
METDAPVLIPKVKRQLDDVKVDYATQRQILLQDVDKIDSEDGQPVCADEVLQPELRTSEEFGTHDINQPGVYDAEKEANLWCLGHDEPGYLPPGHQLRLADNVWTDNADIEDDDADYSDDEMCDLIVGAMQTGYEEEEEEEEAEEEEEEEEEVVEEEERVVEKGEEANTMGNQTTDGGLQPSNIDQSLCFDYREPVGDPLTAKEILSLSLHGIYRRYKTQRRCIEEIGDVMGRVLGPENKPHIERTVNKRIEERTGIKGVKYDCCPKSCMSYSMYPDDTECRVCHHPRWKTITNMRSKKTTEKQVPYAQHTYIPLTHRIRLWWSNSRQAEKMIHYRNTTAEQGNAEGKSTDFWTGQLLQDLRKRDEDRGARTPMFSQDTDLAFFFSTDGVKVFKSRRAFHIWPLLLINLNLPPAERVKRCNMILVGFVPGPKEPKDLDSFLFPLIQEMKMLEKGFSDGFNAARRNTAQETFLLRAYIVCVGADMIGRTKVRMPGRPVA